MTPNVLLVVLDSVRAANVGHHDHEHDTTPFLDGFADRATTYTNARAPATWSLPSHASLFTGSHVVEHGLTRTSDRLRPGHTIFEELADDAGHETAVFSENPYLTDLDVGLRDAFGTVEGARNVPYPGALNPRRFLMETDRDGLGQQLAYLRACLRDEHPVRSIANGAYWKLGRNLPFADRGLPFADRGLPFADRDLPLLDRDLPLVGRVGGTRSTPGPAYVDRFLDWERGRDGPWAACLNLMDAHMPYEPAGRHDRWGGRDLRRLQDRMDDPTWEVLSGERPWWQLRALEGLYDGAIRQLDAAVERLLTAIERRGVLDDTLVVVTSDHGEGFGEPSPLRPGTRVAEHAAGLHEVLLHVPLVVRAPGQRAARTVEAPASLTAFPDVVRAALRGESGADRGFVPDGPVLASFHGLEEPMARRAGRYLDDLGPFNGEALGVVTDGGPGTRTYATWDDERAVAVQAPTAKARYVHSTGAFDRVREAFEPLADADVLAGGDAAEASAETRRRLEHLGYR